MLSERMYRALLVAYPKEHRREYGELMVQLFRDCMRRDGGGLRTLVVWVQMIFDLVRSSFRERMEGAEVWTILTTMFRTILEPRRRWLYLVVMLIPIILLGLAYANTPRSVNEMSGHNPAVKYDTFEQYVDHVDARVKEQLAAGQLTTEHAKEWREWEIQRWDRGIGFFSIFHAPNSIQMVAQTMVTAGALFAVVLGVVSGRAALSSRAARSEVDSAVNRRWALAPYFLAPIFLWILMAAASVGLALLAGSIIPQFLTMKHPITDNSTWNLTIAVVGIGLAGFAWTTVGVSLGVIVRSARIAVIAGIVLVVAEVSIGSVLDNMGIPVLLPTHGAIELASIDAPKLYHGIITPGFGHPAHGPHPLVGAVLLVTTGAAAIVLGLWSWGRKQFVQSPSSAALG